MLLNVIVAIIFIGSILYLNLFSYQRDFISIILPYSLSFLSYYYFIKNKAEDKWLVYLISLICLVGFPRLSDDIYRFIWDGELILKGISPYAYLPTDVNIPKEKIFEELQPKLNSPNYYSIYPFTCQIIFAFSALLSKLSLNHVFGLKLAYLFFHLLGFKYIRKLNSSDKLWQLYYLNPLVIVEGLGNLHAEIIMVGLLILALYYYEQKRNLLASSVFSFAIATKLTPILLLPYFFFKAYKEKQYRFIVYVVLFSILLIIPIVFSKGIFGFTSSLELYFRKFEFNASIYYLIRDLGQLLLGYNIIAVLGPVLALILAFIAIKYSIKYAGKEYSLEKLMNLSIIIFTTHLFLSTTIHPWYLITILFFNIFHQYKFLLVWSFCILFSYSNYHGIEYQERSWVILIEYLIVILVFFIADYGSKQFKKEEF